MALISKFELALQELDETIDRFELLIETEIASAPSSEDGAIGASCSSFIIQSSSLLLNGVDQQVGIGAAGSTRRSIVRTAH